MKTKHWISLILMSFSLILLGVFLTPALPSEAASSAKVLTDVRKAPVKAGRWVAVGNKWKYRYTNGSYGKNTWLKVNGRYYYFLSNSYMATGWLTYNKKKYFLTSNGDMKVGWHLSKGNWYYLKSDGTMATNTFLTYKGKKYRLGSDGKMLTGWNTVSKKKYYFNANGDAQTGWMQRGKNWYYLSSSGCLTPYRKASQLLFVNSWGTYATVIMIEKKSSTVFQEVLRTSGRVGRNGVGQAREGYAATPAGTYTFGYAFGIQSNPGTALPYTKVNSSHYWVDDVSSKYYNRFVSTNTVRRDWNSAEHIIDYTQAYAYVLSIDYNLGCVPGRGSAIFLHCDTGQATGGCVSVPKNDMVSIVRRIRKDALIQIK